MPTSIEFDSPGVGLSKKDARTYKGGVALGATQSFRPCGASSGTTAGAFTFTQAYTLEGPFSAVRFQYANMGAATYTIAAAKCAASPTITTNGSGLTPVDVTFDTSATGKASDVYTGAAGAATTFAVPAKVSGTFANTVVGSCWSDWVPLTSVTCTDTGAENFAVVYHRMYVALACTVPQLGTSASNWGNYNTYSTRKTQGQVTAGDQITAWPNVASSVNWQWMPMVTVQALLYKPCVNHAVFGDSISKGQGSFDQNNGMWGWAQRGVQELTDAGYGTHSLVNYAVSGQGKDATWATFLNVIDQGNMDTATLFPWSPNDGTTAGAAPWALTNFKYQIYAFLKACRSRSIRPILATQPPANVISDAASDLIRVAMNEEIRSVAQNYGRQIVLCDFDAVLTNSASPARFLTGLSVDNTHPSLAGHAAMSTAWKEALKLAVFET